VLDLATGGIAIDAAIDLDAQPCEARAEFLEDRQRRKTLVGDNERALHALLFEVPGDEAASACAEVDGGGKGERRDHGCLTIKASQRSSGRTSARPRRSYGRGARRARRMIPRRRGN